MAEVIEIRDKDRAGFLTFDLADILRIVEPVGRELSWAIRDLHGTGDLGPGGSIPALEREIASARGGKRVSWDQLVILANSLTQTIDGLFIGCRDPSKLATDVGAGDLYRQCDATIEAIDSSLWRVSCKVPDIIEALRMKFDDTELVEAP